jgi:K+-sensing histidine kinase KdpD
MEWTSELFIEKEAEAFVTVLFNLVSNARKYTKAHGNNDEHIAIFVRQTRIGDQEWICFDVDDAGRGLPPDETTWEDLFEPGRRYVHPDSAIPGSGNGLFFARTICKVVLGGVFETPRRSSRGGALFSFRIPFEFMSDRRHSCIH